jgi:hypothetical protein
MGRRSIKLSTLKSCCFDKSSCRRPSRINNTVSISRIKDILSMGHHIIDCDLIGRWRNMTGDTLGIWMVLVADWHSSTRVEDEDF